MHAHTETRASPRPSRSAAERSRPASPVTQRAALANQSPVAGQLTQLAAILNPRAPIAAHLNRPAPAPRNHSPPIVQRQPITPEEAAEALAERSPEFAALPHRIVQTWDSDDEESNCHGYTLTGAMGHSASGSQVVEAVRTGSLPGNVVIFTSRGVIAHSGRLPDAGQLNHLLIGVGVLNTGLSALPEGFTHAFTIPAQLTALDEFLRPAREAQERQQLLRRMMKTARHAVNRDIPIPGAKELQEEVFSLERSPDREDRDAIIARWRAFVAQHQEIDYDSDDDQ